MIANKFDFLKDQSSPLFRIMWAWNPDDIVRRQFHNNVTAFHIGDGFILTVGHVLRNAYPFIPTVERADYDDKIRPFLDANSSPIFDRSYALDPATNRQHIRQTANQEDLDQVGVYLRKFGFDTRFLSSERKSFVTPYLVMHFLDDAFYKDPALTALFRANQRLAEPSINRFTYLLELELVKGWFAEDVALYRITNTDQSIIDRIPSIEVDYRILDEETVNLYCVQASPNLGGSNLGRLFNKAQIEGYIEHHGVAADDPIVPYFTEGFRYLVKTYFKFGSSGAPYVFLDEETNTFKVNAIQSEAAGIQLAINNNREGNFQFLNGIATPLHNIEIELKAHTGQ